jgi:hypothetical protein
MVALTSVWTFALPEHAKATGHDVFVARSAQDADGITPSDMDLYFLRNLEKYWLTSHITKTKRHLIQKGFDPSIVDARISSSSVYLDYNNQRLAIIRIKMIGDDGNVNFRTVLVGGIIGKEFLRVQCHRRSGEPLPVMHGACGDKVSETFGVDPRKDANK